MQPHQFVEECQCQPQVAFYYDDSDNFGSCDKDKDKDEDNLRWPSILITLAILAVVTADCAKDRSGAFGK